MVKEKNKPESVSGEIVDYIRALVEIPSPTGYTRQVADWLVSNAETKGIKYEVTRKGAVIYKFGSEGARHSRMLAVHIDTLGAIVKKVEKETLKFDPIGGYPAEYIVGNYCTIHTFDGKKYTGTILPVNPAVHVNRDLKEKKFKIEDMAIRVDLKLNGEDDKFGNYVEVGNFISFDPGFEFVNGFVKSRFLDDKASAGILLHTADVISKKMNEPGFSHHENIYFFFNITEETGQGISGYPEIDDFLAVDMGAIGEGLQGDEFSVSICAKDSTGPFNYDFTQELVKLCKDNGIGYKVDIFPFYGSDASGALLSGRDIRTALIGPGVAASHGYERTHIDALIGVSKLVMLYLGI